MQPASALPLGGVVAQGAHDEQIVNHVVMTLNEQAHGHRAHAVSQLGCAAAGKSGRGHSATAISSTMAASSRLRTCSRGVRRVLDRGSVASVVMDHAGCSRAQPEVHEGDVSFLVFAHSVHHAPCFRSRLSLAHQHGKFQHIGQGFQFQGFHACTKNIKFLVSLQPWTDILALDQGTGGSKAIVFRHRRPAAFLFQKEDDPAFPRQGWVGQNAVKIWRSVRALLGEAVASVGDGEIAALGISKQRRPR